ncbi:hypothetical protein [Caldisphaera sp.]|uniref:hypothetical protein n=1 Tax=Caldisphaera sp. TaxID=2060322 RepID=UPI0025BB88DF|nr:hypothetical protein [Caldisphaera sp.]
MSIKDLFISPRFNILLITAYVAIGLLVSPLIPGINWLQPGDFSEAEVIYYHGIMLQLTVLGIIIAAYITKFPKKLQLIFNVSNIPLMILNILGIGFSYPAWAISINNAIQGLRDVWILLLAIALLIGLIIFPFLNVDTKNIFKKMWSAYSLLVVATASSLIAGIMGLTAAWGEYLNFLGAPGFFMRLINDWGGTSTFLSNVVTSHSHEMLPALGAAIVAVFGISLNYSSYKGISKRIIDVGMIVAIFGVISMTTIYIISSYGTYVIPTIGSFGPQGVNGIAFDDSQTGIIGWGALIIAVGLIGSGVLSSMVSTKRYLSILEISTWLATIFVLIGVGYPIELNEAFFGFGVNGTPPTGGPGFIYDDLFMRGHLVFAFFLMPILAGIIASVIAIMEDKDVSQIASKILLGLGLTGIILGVCGLLVYMISSGIGEILAIGISLIIVSLFAILYITFKLLKI